MIEVSGLEFSIADGTAEGRFDVTDPTAKLRILKELGWPSHPDWFCQVTVTVYSEALTEEARIYNPLEGGATHDRQINAFDEPHSGGNS